jgi:hypothetical protein
MIWHNFCMSYNHRNHSLRKNGSWKKIHTSRVNNDYASQSAIIICCKHNIHLLSWCLEGWHQENMCLFVQNTILASLTIETKESWTTSCVVVCSTPSSQWNTYIPIGSMACLHMHRERPQAIGWGRPNLIRSAEKKMSKAILKDGMTRWTKN